MSQLPATDFAPLDVDEYRRQELLSRALHCAHPVLMDGKYQYISALTSAESGGRIEMTVYLKGRVDGVDSRRITVEKNV